MSKAKTAKIKELKTLKLNIRRFVLNRNDDESGNSGTGAVAVGTQYPNGKVSLTWLSHMGTMGWYDTIEVVKGLHGHGGKTEVIWLDKEEVKETTMTEEVK
jgi:hypothetical protein